MYSLKLITRRRQRDRSREDQFSTTVRRTRVLLGWGGSTFRALAEIH
jgi:hypothetical protein